MNNPPNEFGADQIASDHTLDPDIINQLPPIPLTQTITNTSVISRNSVMSRESYVPNDPVWPKIWVKVRIALWILGWWAGGAGVFAYYEKWSYFEGIYFAFVSMTGIGYGDFTIDAPVAVEFWWIFMFNAVSFN